MIFPHQRNVDADHPWLGLESFTEATQRYFFGRDTEIADIFVRARENPLTILYGQSGLGKTSLLGAGLIPKLRLEAHRPVLLRLRYEKSDPPLLAQVRAALHTLFPAGAIPVGDQGAQFSVLSPESAAPKPSTEHSAPSTSSSLWELLHHTATRPADLASAPPVLIFDQFEEAFTLGQRAERLDEVRALFTELADVIENRPPAAVKQRFTEDRRLVRDYDLAPSPLRVVITLREDYLSHLEAWKKILPSLMRNRMALHLLNGPQALDAVLKPGNLEGRHLVDADTAARIVRFVANRGPDVPLDDIGAVPPLLSLVCDELNTQRLEQGRDRISADRVITGTAKAQAGDDDDLETRSRIILQRFYQRSFTGFPAGVRHFIEDSMVTTAGHRRPVSRDDAIAALSRCKVKNPTETMQALVTRRLISTEERDGVQWFEITHDVLVPIVKESKDKRLARQRLRRMVLATLSLLLVLGVFGGITLWAVNKQREALEQRDEARYNEGLAWMLRAEVAEERSKRYPETLLYAAQAIGFEGFGRPADAELPLRYIRAERDRPAFDRAQQWIAGRPAYLPVWASALRHAPATALCLSPTGRWLALASEDGRVVIIDPVSGAQTSVPGPASDLAFDPREKTLAIAAKDKVKFWDLAKNAMVVVGRAYSATPDAATNKGAPAESPGSAAAQAPETSGLKPHSSYGFSAIAWSPDGEMLAAACADGSVRLWVGDKVTTLASGIATEAARLAFSVENSLIAAAYPGKGVRVFFPHAGSAANAWLEHQADSTSIAISPDGQRLAIGGADGGISLWSTADARQLGSVPAELRHKGAVLDLAFRPDGRQLASASADGTVKLWSSTTDIPGVIATLCGHTGAVSRVSYAPDGTVLASAGADGSARLWSVSGMVEPHPDLLAYLDQRFFAFDPATQQARWAGGAGFIVAPAVITARQLSAEFLASNAWGAALALRSTEDQPALVQALVADAQAAAKENRWHRVDLRLHQLATTGGDAELWRGLFQQRAAFAMAGESFTNVEGQVMIWCPPTGPDGFLMGSPKKGVREAKADEPGRNDYETQHQVVLTTGFWLCKHETTQAVWTSVMGGNPSTYASSGPQAPVENISWTEAVEFCRRLTDRERARGTLPAGLEYALPSEAQWEYACRAGTKTAYSFGDDPAELHKYGNYNDKTGGFNGADKEHDDGKEYTATVGTYPANVWGLHDMHGNVFEWCQDAINPEAADYPAANASDPLATKGTLRVYRGGGWNASPRDCRSAIRNAFPPSARYGALGFRPALVPFRPVSRESK